jgi:hypothetical protein
VVDQLVAAVAGGARSDTASILRLDVGVNSPRVRHAYERWGFVATGHLWSRDRDASTVEETIKRKLQTS